ncbi:MAG: hypothetical protein AB1490_13810 [Pseudomonadota bacterium]
MPILQWSKSLATVAALLAWSGAALAQFERPPNFAANKIPGIKIGDENYSIQDPVRSDGLLRLYTLGTPYGDVNVQGDQMLKMRIVELAALRELEKISGSESFGKALAEAGLSPLKYTGRLITNPAQTVQDTFSGIGNMFGRIGANMNNMGKTNENAVASLLGVTEQRRKLATRFGVDPYTDLSPLSAKLERLSEAAATGGLTVSGALFVVPGAAGIVVSNLSTANRLGDAKLEDLARDYTPAQIMDLNRQRLKAMEVEPELIEALLVNRNYTPIDLAATVAALDSMNAVADRRLFFQQAQNANSRGIAYFTRKRAEMIAAHRGGLTQFIILGGYPFNLTRDGRVVGIMPVDALSWTETTSKALSDAAADAKRRVPNARGELRISGQATALAKQKLKALGWSVVENVRF